MTRDLPKDMSRDSRKAVQKHTLNSISEMPNTISACKKHENAARISTNHRLHSVTTKSKTSDQHCLYLAGGTGGIGGTSGPVPFSVGNTSFRTG